MTFILNLLIPAILSLTATTTPQPPVNPAPAATAPILHCPCPIGNKSW